MFNKLLGITENESYIIAFWTGRPLFVSKVIADDLMNKSTENKVETFVVNDCLYNFKDIKFMGPEREYYDKYPENNPKGNFASQSYPIRDFDEMAEKYTDFKYPRLKELSDKVYGQLKNLNDKQFQEYCLKHKAILPDGSVSTTVITEKDGDKKSAAFAFPFFIDIWNLIQREKEKRNYAVEMSWEQLEKGAGYEGVINFATKTSHIEAMARGIKKAIDKRKKEGLESKNTEELLKSARKRYALVKN